MKNKEQTKNRILSMHKMLICLCIGTVIYYNKNKTLFSEEEKNMAIKVLKYSFLVTSMILLSLLLFIVSPFLFNFGSLYVFSSILLPASIVFHLTIYVVGISELKKGRNFIYPFVG